MKKLAKESAIYGVSSILGKFLNWLLVPLYTVALANSAEYGVVVNLYAYTALLLVIFISAVDLYAGSKVTVILSKSSVTATLLTLIS